MSISLLFWLLMLLWLCLGIAPRFPRGATPAYFPFVGDLLLFVLIALLGWRVFGAAIHG